MSAVDQVLAQLVTGQIGRRQFIERATVLGVSAAGLTQMLAMVDARQEAEAAGLNTLTLNAVQVFGVIDPAISIDYTQEMAMINFYDTLLTPTPSASVTNRLAESWHASSDARTFTFTLRKGVKFHSGRELTAADVVYSMQRMLTINQGPSFVWQGFLEAGGVRALNRYTVEFRLLKPFAPFPSTLPLFYILDSAAVKAHHAAGKYGANGDYGTKWLANHEAGSGPYTLESDVEGTELRMKKFPGYFRGWHAHSLDEVRVMIVTEEATVVSLAKTGVLDMTSQFQANPTYDTLKQIGFNIWQAPTETVFYLKMNTRKAPTDDIHVRRAIALAFDYDTVRAHILPGAPVGGPLAPIFKDAYDSALPLPKQNLAAAKAELAKSKYAHQSSIPLTMTYVSNTPFETQIGLLFNSIMENLGFKVSLEPNPWNRITDLATNVNTTPNVSQVFYGVIYPSPDSMFFVQYDSKSAGSWASMEWLNDPTVDQLIAKSRVTLDTQQRNRIYKQIQARIVQLQPDAFVLAQLWRQAVRSNVSGFTYIPAGTYQFYDLKKV